MTPKKPPSLLLNAAAGPGCGLLCFILGTVPLLPGPSGEWAYVHE